MKRQLRKNAREAGDNTRLCNRYAQDGYERLNESMVNPATLRAWLGARFTEVALAARTGHMDHAGGGRLPDDHVPKRLRREEVWVLRPVGDLIVTWAHAPSSGLLFGERTARLCKGALRTVVEVWLADVDGARASLDFAYRLGGGWDALMAAARLHSPTFDEDVAAAAAQFNAEVVERHVSTGGVLGVHAPTRDEFVRFTGEVFTRAYDFVDALGVFGEAFDHRPFRATLGDWPLSPHWIEHLFDPRKRITALGRAAIAPVKEAA
jgi:hypothetical protein